MMTTKTDVAAAIVAALRAQESAKQNHDNPLDSATLADLVGGTRGKGDNTPAKVNETDVALRMEAARLAGLKVGSVERRSRRRKAARQRQARIEQIEQIAALPEVPDAERLRLAWSAVTPIFPRVLEISKGKQRWVQRYLGDLTADTASIAVERLVLILAKSDKDLDITALAATCLAAGQYPDDETRKALIREASWLMAVANNCVLQALDQAYRSDENVRWESLSALDSVLSHVAGPNDDPLIAKFHAKRAPQMNGWRWTEPGMVDPALLSVAVTAAISDRGLDALTDLLLDDANRNPSGSFRWRDLAQDVFLSSPGNGEWMWSVVCNATQPMNEPRQGRAEAARTWAQRQYSWLPGFIVAAASAVPEIPVSNRCTIVPALTYASAHDAAAAIARLLMGEDD